MTSANRFLPPAVALIVAGVALASERATVTAADYARAEKFLAPNLAGLVVGGSATPTWLPDGRFWFRNQTQTGSEIVVVDPARAARTSYPDCAAAGVNCSAEAGAGGR